MSGSDLSGFRSQIPSYIICELLNGMIQPLSKEVDRLIRTLPVGADPRDELKCRLRFLQDVEIPMLQAEWGDSGHLGMAALRAYSERELRDIAKLFAELTGPFLELGSDGVVHINDCVTLQDQAEPAAEEMIVHDAFLIIRAPGYISADSVLGAAVLGRQVGDLVRVDTRSGTRTYALRKIRRAFRDRFSSPSRGPNQRR